MVEPVEEVKNVDPLLAARQAWLQHFEETWPQASVQKNLPLLKVKTLSFFCRTVPEAEFATQIQQKKHRNMYLNSRLKSIRLHLPLSKRRSLLVQMLQKQVQLRKNKGPKMKGWKEAFKKKIGIISAIAVL